MDLPEDIDAWNIDEDQDADGTPRSQSITDERDTTSESSDTTRSTSEGSDPNDGVKTQQYRTKKEIGAARRSPTQDIAPKKSYNYISLRVENFSHVFLGLFLSLLLLILCSNFVNRPPLPDAWASLSRPNSESDLSKACVGHDIFAVMGKTGVGKSTFIQRLGGRNKYGNPPEISGSIESCTTTTTYYKATIDNQTVCFLDTPGFDDSNGVTVQQTFNQLWDALPQSQLARGLLYFHDVSSVRVGGVSVELFKIFGDLCGESQIDRVVLVPVSSRQNPTKDEVEQEARHLRELQDKYWKPMRLEGSRTMRFNHSQDSDSALRIIRHLTELPKRRPSSVAERPLQQNKSTVTMLFEYIGQARHGYEALRFTKECVLEARRYGGAILGF